ncbi:MAG: polyphenol oxidase family protein [Candidatus Chromulinivorax sp.]|nr:polyphenol oxidase family protein [Candidatus Chromulinivorax sp.]
MFIIQNQKFTIYFGDAEQSISLDEIEKKEKTSALAHIEQELKLKQVVFLKQEHGILGKVIDLHDHQNYFFDPVGDYLITQKKDCGIGVVTADCLPIVIYDSVTQTAAIIHAGWKGLVAGIFEKTILELITLLRQGFEGQNAKHFEIYLGPAARPCCYEVQQDFVELFCETSAEALAQAGQEQFREYQKYSHEFFIQRDGKTYFDSRSFIVVIARNLGIADEKLYTRYNLCTICNLSFCSYRREQTQARRQVTMICLH